MSAVLARVGDEASRTLARAYLAAHGSLLARPALGLALALALWVAAAAGLARLELDLSFRPLFLAGAASVEPTRDFEREFGQLSGAHALVIVERAEPFDGDALRELDAMAASLARVHGFAEVLGGARWVAAGRMEGRPMWVSADGRRVLLAARFDAPMEDLARRREALAALESEAARARPTGARLHFTGVTVVEAGYADRLLRDQLAATALTTAALAVLLVSMFGGWRAAVACLVPVGFAVSALMGLLGWVGASVTVINSVLPVIVMVIGIADAVHMVSAWLDRRRGGADPPGATRAMLAETGRACALTACTSALGFLALGSAQLPVIGDFGREAAAGLVLAWLANQVLVPWLLLRLQPRPAPRTNRVNRMIDASLASCTALALRRPLAVLASATALTAACAVAAFGIETDQRFNEELAPDHPVAVAQRLLEGDFGGFLGPEIDVRRRDRGPLDASALRRTEAARAAMLRIPGTDSFDVVASPSGDRLALVVRTSDVGTRRALAYGTRVERVAREAFGNEYVVAIVGPWWLAQQGMNAILGDMLRSIATSLVTVVPVLALALGSLKLLAVGTAANIAPMFVPLAFMWAAGIELRIGTAVVTTIALGIVVDDTLHGLSRLRALAREGLPAQAQVTEMMRTTGRALVYSNVALMAGFLSMLGNQFQAIRDMGLAAAVTFAAALAFELLVVPAMYLVLCRRPIR